MKKVDIGIGICLILLALVVIHFSGQLPVNNSTDVGAGFFPKWISYILILLSVIMIFNGIKTKPEAVLLSKKSLLSIGITIVYLGLIYLTGFYISTTIYMIIFMWIFKERKKWFVLLVTVLVTAGIYVVFEQVLQVPMPSGLFLE